MTELQAIEAIYQRWAEGWPGEVVPPPRAVTIRVGRRFDRRRL